MNEITKPRVFLYGGCDLQDMMIDVLKKDFDIIDYAAENPNEIDNKQLDLSKHSVPNAGTSVISLYSEPGDIAQRVLETLATGKSRDVILNKTLYDEIVKFPWLDFYRKNAGPNDYILISFSPELYTKFIKGKECFTCVPQFSKLGDPKNPLNWLWKEYISKDQYQLPFDTKESLEWSFDLMVDFARDIYEIFQDRVILVKTHLSDFVISKDHTIKNIKVGPDNLMFYRQTKVISDPTDHKYAERLSNIIMNKFRHHYKSDIDVIKLNEPVFIDANHKWGFSQFHIDLGSRTKLAKLIHENLVRKTIKIQNVIEQ